MSYNTYDNGALVRCAGAFTTTASGSALDPTTVRFEFKDPSGTTTAYLYGTDSQLVKDSVGNYHVDLNANLDGVWSYRFWSTGTGQAANEASFTVTSIFT